MKLQVVAATFSDESLGAIQELKFLPVKLNKEEENSISDVKDLNQFFSCLGGSLWEEQVSSCDIYNNQQECSLQPG